MQKKGGREEAGKKKEKKEGKGRERDLRDYHKITAV